MLLTFRLLLHTERAEVSLSAGLVVCLSFFAVANEYRSDVNRENPLGCEGQLAYSFAALVKKLWNGENEYLYPRNLKVCVCLCVCACACVCVYVCVYM